VNVTAECSNGHDSRTDVWSFGCILIQICNLDVPFNANTELRLIQKIKTMHHRNIDQCFSLEIRQLYEACLNKNY
jgi:NIMA (never in mitosis gene a)-related kinase 2